jgi:hypothetical protein
MSAPDTARRRGYLRHNWSHKDGAFRCLRRGCKATWPDWRRPVCRRLKKGKATA